MILTVIETMEMGGRKRIIIVGGLVGAQFYTYFFQLDGNSGDAGDFVGLANKFE